MSSYAELHQQQGGLLAVDANGRQQGYARLYLQQQADATTRRSFSSFHPYQAADAAARRSYTGEQYRVAVSAMDEEPSQSMSMPGHHGQGSYAAMAAVAAAAAATEAFGSREDNYTSSPGRPVPQNAAGAQSPSPPRQRLDPSVSRPVTTILAQATAMRAARLKQLAQRQQLVQQPPPALSSAAARRAGSRHHNLLSTVLQQAPYLYDRQRLSAVERFIERVDTVPARFAEAQVVFLSKNSLTSVAGLEQFRGLRVLGLADNLLADPDQLEALAAACPGLEALSLEGNPIAYVPYYRSRVVLALPGLKALDGRPVTEEERAAAPAAVAAEEATMAVLLRNACEVHKMASVVQRAQLHMELLHAVHGRGAVLRRVEARGDAAGAGRSLSRLLDLWDYEGLLSTEERRKIRGALLREVGRMYRQLKAQQPAAARTGPTWEEAFAQVMTAQQQTTAALLDLLTQCQLATDELVRSMAVAGPEGGAGAAAGGSGRDEGRHGAARALLLQEAEADVERNRAMRREREEVLTEFRNTAMNRSRASPMRPALRPVLKSSLKRTSQPTPKASGSAAASYYDGGGSDGAENDDRRSPSPSRSAPPRWQSARSSPLAPEAVERLMRARRGVVPTRASVSSTGYAAATGRSEEQPQPQQPRQQQQQPQSPHPGTRPSGTRAFPAESSFAGARILRRPVSADRASARYPDQQQQQFQQQQRRVSSTGVLSARSQGGMSGGGGGPSGRLSGGPSTSSSTLLAAHRRSKSVDAASLRGRGTSGGGGAGVGSGGGGGGGRVGSASTGRALPLQRRSPPGSPYKESLSPTSPIERPAWRPAGAKPGCGCGHPRSTSPNYKDAARAAVWRSMQGLVARSQEVAGTSPERLRALTAGTAVATAAAAAAAEGSPTSWPGLPNRGVTTSPTIAGRRHSSLTVVASPPRHAAGAYHQAYPGPGPESLQHGPGPQARRSLQGVLMGTEIPASRSSPSRPGGMGGAFSSGGGGGGGSPRSPGASGGARSSSPAFHGSSSGGARSRSTSPHAAVSSARIDDLRRQVEESARETAYLRQVAEAASQPLPQRLPPAVAAQYDGAGWAAPPPWSQEPGHVPGPEYGWHGQGAPPPPQQHWQQPDAAWGGGQAAPGYMQNPYDEPDLTLRPREWNGGAAAHHGPAASPQPQPQAPPPSLQPHRGAWSGPSPQGGGAPMPTQHGQGRALAGEGSSAGFVNLYPGGQKPDKAGAGGGGAVPPHGYGPAEGPNGAGAAYDLLSLTPGQQHQYHEHHYQQQHHQHHYQQQHHQPPRAGAQGVSGGGAERHAGEQGSGASGPPGGPGYATGSHQQTASQRPQPRAHTAQMPHGAAWQVYQPPPPPAAVAAPFHPHLQHPQPGPFQGGGWPPQEAAAYAGGGYPAGRPGGGPPSPPRAVEPHARHPVPAESDQVTLDDFSLVRASLDVMAPNSMQPSATGTPSHGRQPDGASPALPFQRMGPGGVDDGSQMHQPVGVVDTPWPQGMPPLPPREGQGYGSAWRGTAGAMATPAFTLRGPPAAVGAAATPGGTTIVSIADDSGGGGGAATRVDVEEVMGEDSTGSKDQHIHLHIHPPPVQLPGTAGTDASTPHLFLQSAQDQHHQHHRAAAAATAGGPAAALTPPSAMGLSPADGMSASLGLLVQPGSPLHEALSAGHLVYEKIERIKPAGRGAVSTPNSARGARRASGTETVGLSANSSEDREAQSSRRRGRRRSGRTAAATPHFTVGAGGGGGDGRRRRDEHPGFGYGEGEGQGSNASGGDSYDLGRGDRSGVARLAREGEGSRVGASGGGRRDDRAGRPRRAGDESSGDDDDDVDDTDLNRDDSDNDSDYVLRDGRGRGGGGRTSPGRLGSGRQGDEGSRHRGDGSRERRDAGATGSRERRGDQGSGPGAVGETGRGAAASPRKPSPLRPPPGPSGMSPRGTFQSWVASPNSGAGGGSGSSASPRVVRPISPVAAAGAAAASGHSSRGSSPAPASPHDRGGRRSPPQGSPSRAGGGGTTDQIQSQLLRNRAVQDQVSRLGERLAANIAEVPPELAATLAGLAASSSPLPPGSLRALEHQLVSLTLEKEAVERVLVQEQAEVRLLQQELGVMAQVAGALEQSQAQLQEARLAVAHQQQELQERDQKLAVTRDRAAELEAELAAERERSASQVAAIASYFEQQFEDARTAVVSELREQVSAMTAGRSPRQPRGSDSLTDLDEQELAALLAAMPAELRADLEAQVAGGRDRLAAQLAALRADPAVLRALQQARAASSPGRSPGRRPEITEAEHAAQLAVLRAEHTMQTELMRARHAVALEALAADKAAQPEAIREQYTEQLARTRSEHARQMEELQARHEAQMEVLMAERVREPEALRAEHASQLASLRSEHVQQMELLRAEHAKEVGLLVAERAALPEALKAAHAATLEAVRSEHAARIAALKADHGAQMETMRSSHNNQLQTMLSERASQPEELRAEHVAAMAALSVDFTQQMEALRGEYAKQLEALAAEKAAVQRQQAQPENVAQLAQLRSEHMKQMESMRSELTAQIESLLGERTSVLQALKDDHASALEAVRSGHISQLASLSTEHARQMEAMRSEHAKQMERLLGEMAAQPEVLRAGYSTQVAALRAEHAMQVEALRAEQAAALAERERQRAAAAAAHEQQLASMRTETQQRLEEVALQARQRMARQEADHRALTAALSEEHEAQLAQHTRRLDELLGRHRQQLDELQAGNSRQLDEVRRQGERLLGEARAEAARAVAEAVEEQERAMAELEAQLRAAEAAEAAAVAARRESEAARAALQAQLDEALTALGRERMSAGELRGRNQALEVAETETRRRLEKLMAPQDLGWRRGMEADRLGSRFLLRRVLGHWAANARVSRRQNHQVALGAELRRRRLGRVALQHWRSAVQRTRALRALLRAREAAMLRKALVSLKAQTLQRRRKARAVSVAVAHWSTRQLSRCFEAWRQLHRMHARAAAYSDAAALRAAVAHHSDGVLRAALEAWHRHVYQTQLPKMQRRRRAAHVNRRRLLRKAMAGFTQQAERRALKRAQLARSVRRHRFSVLNRALACWLRFLGGTRRKRSLLGTAELQYGHAVMQRWRRAAARSRALRLGLAALQASAGTRRLRTCMARWRAVLLHRRQSALAVRLASEHHRGSLLWRCMASWLQLAQKTAARQLHISGMREYQRMMQAALRWQRLVELGRRQQAVVDRAVRLYRHRVLAGTQRAVLRHWRAVVEGRQGRMRSAALGFVHAFLIIWRRRILAAWQIEARRAVAQRGIEMALELRSALERNEGAMRQLSARLEALGEEHEATTEQLNATRSEVLVLRQQLAECEKRLAEAIDALATVEREVEAQAADLAARADRIAALEAERDELMERVGTLRQQVAAGEVSIESLQEQAAALQRSLAAAQGAVREMGVKLHQQAAHYEEQLLAARDEASLARREAGSMAATASRLEQQAADSEAQLKSVRSGHEALVASLRQELRVRDAHIMALNQAQQQQRDSAVAQSRPGTAAAAAAARPPSPVVSPRPLSAREARALRPGSARTRSAGGVLDAVAAAERRGGGGGFGWSEEAAGADAEAEQDQGLHAWEPPDDRPAARLRPLYEPSPTLNPAAAAAAVAAAAATTTTTTTTAPRADSQPWSAGPSSQRPPATAAAAAAVGGPQRGGRPAPAGVGALPRTSLLMSHPPIVQTRASAPPPPPPPPPADDVRLWAEGSALDALAGAVAAPAAAAAAAAATILPEFSIQPPTDDSSSEWPAVMHSNPAPKAPPLHDEEHDHYRGSGGGDSGDVNEDNDDYGDGDGDGGLPAGSAQYGGASSAFRRLQMAEAALRATEAEFQRRRSRILGLEVPPPPPPPPGASGEPSTASSSSGGAADVDAAPQPQHSLSPRLPPGGPAQRRATAALATAPGVPPRPPQTRSVPAIGIDLGGLHSDLAAAAAAAADGGGGGGADTARARALRHSASELLERSLHVARERMEALAPGRLRSSVGDGNLGWAAAREQPQELEQEPQQRRRSLITDPGDTNTSCGGSGSGSDGGGSAAVSQQSASQAELDDLTAGIVGTLTNLREALRAQKASRPPPPPLPPPPPSQRPTTAPAAATTAAGGAGGEAWPGMGRGGAAVGHRTVSFGPTTPFFSTPTSAAGSETGGSSSGDGGSAVEVTLREMLRSAATAPPLPPTAAASRPDGPAAAAAAATRFLQSQQQQQSGGLDRRLSADSASALSDASRLAEASEMLSRSLASLISGAAAEATASAGTGGGGGSAPSSVLAWLRATAPGEGERVDENLDLAALRKSPGAGAVAAAGGRPPVRPVPVTGPERGHEMYTRIGAHVASVVEEALLAEEAAAAGVAAAGVPAGRALLRRTVDTLFGEAEDYSTIDADAY
ncbi:hypothetical protein PLESTF_000716600 [Pleodorina starrii]|nr:hypothetical protein PLESTF_000716600 [Pleodorina starrii]